MLKHTSAVTLSDDLCFAPFVWGKYETYIPVYVYTVLRAYPDSYVKVFLRGVLDGSVRDSLQFVRDGLSDRFEVIEHYCSNLIIGDTRLIRWLIPEEYFQDYENVYFGDVDILVIRERLSILEGHLKHCSDINLPYSNVIRSEKRLTGLHFVKREPYYEKMDSVIEEHLKHPELVADFRASAADPCDECFLYYLMESLGLPPLTAYYRPHHGLHLSRHFRPGSTKMSSEEILGIEKEGMSDLLNLFQEPVFNNMLKALKDHFYINTNLNNLRNKIQQNYRERYHG